MALQHKLKKKKKNGWTDGERNQDCRCRRQRVSGNYSPWAPHLWTPAPPPCVQGNSCIDLKHETDAWTLFVCLFVAFVCVVGTKMQLLVSMSRLSANVISSIDSVDQVFANVPPHTVPCTPIILCLMFKWQIWEDFRWLCCCNPHISDTSFEPLSLISGSGYT